MPLGLISDWLRTSTTQIRESIGISRGNGLRAQLIRGGVGSLSANIAGTGLAFLVVVVLARTLGPDGYGVYAFVIALIQLLGIPALLGLPQLMVRETARAEARGEWGRMRGLWRWSTGAVALFSLVIASSAALVLAVLGDRVDETRAVSLLVGLLLIPLLALGNLRGAALRGLRRVVLGLLPEHVLRPGLLVLFVVSAIIFGPVQSTPIAAVALHILAAAIAFAVGALLLYRARPVALIARPEPVYQPRQWLAAAVPLAFIVGLQIINQNTDILMLGLLRQDVEVGVYRVAAQLALAVGIVFTAVNLVVAPYIVRLHAQGDHQRLQLVATRSARVALTFAFPAVAVLTIFGREVIGLLFGEAYTVGGLTLVILSWGQLVKAVTGCVATLLNMVGLERETLRGLAIAAIVNITLNLLLIPSFGIEGAAVASTVALITWNVLLWRAASCHLGINSSAF